MSAPQGDDAPTVLLAVTEVATSFDGETLAITWTKPDGASAPEAIEITLQGPWARQTMVVSNTYAQCDLPVRRDLSDQPGDWVLTLTPLLDGARGPAHKEVIERFSAPSALSARWPSSSELCTLAWEAAKSGYGSLSASYRIEILSGDVVAHAETVESTLYEVSHGVLTAAGGYSFRVCGVDGASLPSRAGLWSATAPIVSGAPPSLAVDYDGATLSARWEPVPGASGYRLTLMAGGAEQGSPWFVTGTQSQKDLPFEASTMGGPEGGPPKPPRATGDLEAYTLAVQATGPGAVGPAATAPVFGAGFYPSLVEGKAPMLIPARAPDMAPHPITLGLPDLFAAPPSDLPEVPPFSVRRAAQGPYAHVLEIAGSAPGALDPWAPSEEAVRADLYHAYRAFLDALEARGATPSGVQTVVAAIARAMPQTFAETLLYAHGFWGKHGAVDLRPGTLLRAEHEGYQAAGGYTSQEKSFSGFFGSGVTRFGVARAPGGFVALDAFIGWLTAHGGTVMEAPSTARRRRVGASGLIDSGRAEMQKPFLRLVYPSTVPSGEGANSDPSNVMILAASTLRALDEATVSVREGSAIGSDIGALYFRGRVTLVPEIRVWVNGAALVVPIGTTVADVLAELGMDPPEIDLPLRGLKLRRGPGRALVGSPDVYDARYLPVRLDWAPRAKAVWTSLPLLAGDRLEVG